MSDVLAWWTECECCKSKVLVSLGDRAVMSESGVCTVGKV